jgi:hypothetical protein
MTNVMFPIRILPNVSSGEIQGDKVEQMPSIFMLPPILLALADDVEVNNPSTIHDLWTWLNCATTSEA